MQTNTFHGGEISISNLCSCGNAPCNTRKVNCPLCLVLLCVYGVFEAKVKPQNALPSCAAGSHSCPMGAAEVMVQKKSMVILMF